MVARLTQVADRIRNGHSRSLLLLELALDTVSIALADLGTISERRSFRLNDSTLSMGLPMNLAASSSGVNHGLPVLQAVASALVGEMKRLAVPSAALCVSGTTASDFAVERMMKILDLMDGVLTVEIMMAAQGMDLVLRQAPELTWGRGTAAAHQRLRKAVPFAEKDRFFRADLESARALVRSGQLLEAVGKTSENPRREVR